MRIGAKVSANIVLAWALQASDAVRAVDGYGQDPHHAVTVLQRLAGEMEKAADDAEKEEIG